MSIRCHGGIWGSGGIAALTNVDAGWVWSASGPGRFALGEELPVWIEYEVRWARELVLTPVLRVITMVTPNRNCGLFKKSQFIEFTFIWLNLLSAENQFSCDILGFLRGWTEFFFLLGYYAAWGGFKPTFRNYLSDILTLEDGTGRYSRKLVSNHLTPRNNPEGGRIQNFAFKNIHSVTHVVAPGGRTTPKILKTTQSCWPLRSHCLCIELDAPI